MVDLSILICGVSNRLDTFLPKLVTELSRQINGRKNVQLLCLIDNKIMTVGEKRNQLIASASGRYVSFIDDDDMVSGDYVDSLLEGIKENTDVVCFDAFRYVNRIKDKQVKYGIQYRKDHEDSNFYYRIPNHLMCFKTSLIINKPYDYINCGEDALWARSVFYDIKTQHTIDKVLYYYYFSPETTETQK